MMALIDRDEIVKVAEHAYNEWNLAMAAADGEREINLTFKMQDLCKAVKAVAMAAPVVDAKPVVHGEWEFGETLHHPWMKCSVCNVSQSGHTSCFSFCPNCGADMRGREISND